MNINFTLNVSTEDLVIFKEFGKYLIDSETADRKEHTKRQFIEKLAGVVIGQIKNAAENEPEQENDEQPQDVNDDQAQPSQPNITEAEQQWVEIRHRNINRDIAVWHMPPQLEEVANALGYTVSDLPDVITRLVDGEYGEISVEDLQMIEKKIGEKIYFRQAGNDDIDVADLDPSDYPLTEDKEDEEEDDDESADKLCDEELYENIEWNTPPVILFNGLDMTKDDLVDCLHLNGANELPSDLVFGAGDIISFDSFKHLAQKLKHTTLLVRLPKGIFEIKNLNLAAAEDASK